ncbi:hypothetical protein OTU49_001634, partial [Cherax quadricarinatus]
DKDLRRRSKQTSLFLHCVCLHVGSRDSQSNSVDNFGSEGMISSRGTSVRVPEAPLIGCYCLALLNVFMFFSGACGKHLSARLPIKIAVNTFLQILALPCHCAIMLHLDQIISLHH